MTELGSAIRRLGSPDAISWPVFWVTFIAGFIGNAISNAQTPLGPRLLALALGQIVLWLPLAMVGIALRRRPDRSRPVLVLTTALFGLFLRALSIGVVLGAFVDADASMWTHRFVGAIFNVGLSFVVSAYVVAVLRERRRQVVELQETQQRLSAVLTELNEEFVTNNEALAANVRAALLNELKALDMTDAKRSLDVLQHVATEVIRPLSHELASARTESERSAPATTNITVSWRNVLKGATTGEPFKPGLTAGIFGIELIAASVGYPPGILIFFVLLVATWGFLTLANRVLRVVLPGRRQVTRLLYVLMCALIAGLLNSVILLVGLTGAPPVKVLALGGFVITIALSLGVGIASSFVQDRQRIVHDLEQSSLSLERRIVRMRQVRWYRHKALSRVLHGYIQTAVTAAALRIDTAIRTGDIDSTVIEQSRHSVLEALGGITNRDMEVMSWEEASQRLAATWEGLCAISSHVDTEAGEQLKKDAVLRSCMLDIVTEAVSNGIRHGGATRVSVGISHSPMKKELNLVIINNTHGWLGEYAPGLGMRLLEECTLQWELVSSDGEVVLTARLPFDAHWKALPASGSSATTQPSPTS